MKYSCTENIDSQRSKFCKYYLPITAAPSSILLRAFRSPVNTGRNFQYSCFSIPKEQWAYIITGHIFKSTWKMLSKIPLHLLVR
jgi:hypothetical protein